MANPNDTGAHRVSADDIVQDLFGLNLRGLRSIWTLVVRPRHYFEAATYADWQGRFTPSVRLWLSLLAIFSLLKVWFISADSPLVAAYADGFRAARVMPVEGETFESLGQAAALWTFGLVPFLQFAAMFLIATIYPIWGEKTNFALRQRYLFGIVTPSATLGLFLVIAMVLVPPSLITAYAFAMAAVSFIVDTVTGARGVFGSRGAAGRLWRAALLALAVATLNIAVNVLAQIAGILVVGGRLTVPAG
jgi:hypothetical protein